MTTTPKPPYLYLSPALLKFSSNDSTNPLKRFIRLRKINKSEIRGDLDYNSSIIYLDGDGNLIIKNDLPTQIFQNPMATKSADISTLAIIDIKRSVNSLFTGKNNFLHSKNSKWLLFTGVDIEEVDKNCIHILYNPFYRKEFKDAYNSSNYSAAARDWLELYYQKLVQNDPYFTCYNNSVCKSNYFGTQENLVAKADEENYKIVAGNCKCFNPTCTIYTKYMDKTETFLDDVFQELPCPTSIGLTICNAKIEAGGSVNNVQNSFVQNCSTKIATDSTPIAPPAPQPTTRAPAPPITQPPAPPITQPPAPPITQPPAPQPTTKPLVDPSKKGGTLSATPNNNSLKIKIAIASTVLLLLILLLVYFFVDL